MKDLFRLLMVAALSFAVVGAALLYSRESDALGQFSSMLQTGAGKLQAVATTVVDDQADTIEETVEMGGLTRIWLARPNQDVWMGLAGFPDQLDTRFMIPSGINLVQGALELELVSDLSDHGDGRVTISVNGKRRGEIVLNTGREVHKVSIELDPEDLLGSQVMLELAGRGTTNTGQICPTDAANSGAAITLSPNSGLALYTDEAIVQPDIRIASLAEPFTLSLGQTSTEQAVAIWATQKVRRAGIGLRLAGADELADVVMTSGGEALSVANDTLLVGGEAGIDRLIAHRKPGLVTGEASWPVSAAALGAETLVKNFRGSRRWTLPYNIADLPAGLMPRTLALALKTSRLIDGNDWVVRVSLNGNLLVSERVPGSSDTIALDVDLPTDMQGLANSILIELIDTSPNDSICRVGPDAQAQLLASTELRSNGGQPAAGWGEMVRALARAETIGLSADTPLTLAQAQRARALIQQFLPSNASMAFGNEVATAAVQLKMMPVSQLIASLDVASRMTGGTVSDGTKLYFVVGIAGDTAGQPALVDLSDKAIRDWLAVQNGTETGILIMR